MSSDSQAFGVDATGEFEAVLETELVGEEHFRTAPEPEAEHPATSGMAAVSPPAEEGRHSESVPPPELRLLKRSDVTEAPDAAAFAARLEAAMAASARTEAALADLLRTAKFLSASIASVRSANAHLVRELEVLAALVDGDDRERTGLERRIIKLERVLEEARHAAKQERQFLVAEHDAFIATLVSDHERELGQLRARLAEFTNEKPDRDSQR